MESFKAAQLSEVILRKAEEFNKLCEGIDEETASSAPPGRWSPKEIVSHLTGAEGVGQMPTIYAFVQKDTPTLIVEVENSFFSEDRGRMTLVDLLAEFDREYNRIAAYVAGLSEEQLNRRAHMPFLKETPFGEFPTLAEWIQLIGEFHLGWHTDHVRKVLGELGAGTGIPRGKASQEAHPASTVNL